MASSDLSRGKVRSWRHIRCQSSHVRVLSSHAWSSGIKGRALGFLQPESGTHAIGAPRGWGATKAPRLRRCCCMSQGRLNLIIRGVRIEARANPHPIQTESDISATQQFESDTSATRLQKPRC